jgi:hypothetical protein
MNLKHSNASTVHNRSTIMISVSCWHFNVCILVSFLFRNYGFADRKRQPYCFRFIYGADGTPFQRGGITTYSISFVDLLQGLRSRKHCFSILIYSGKEDDPILYYYNCLLTQWIEALEKKGKRGFNFL